MDLRDTEAYRAFRQDVRDFIAANRHRAPAEHVLSYRLNPRRFSPQVLDWQELLVEHGYASRTVPTRYGGYGAEPDVLKSKIIADEFFAAGVPQGLFNQGISMLTPTLLKHGTEAQKQALIHATIRARMVWCQGYSEPGAGSDLASLKTRAEDDGDDFVINGQKIWTSSAHIADMIFCLVRTEPDRPRHAGISYLVFPMDLPGIEVRPLATMTGHASFNEVFFTDVRVPKTAVVGGRGEGWTVANSTLKHERAMLGDPNGAIERLNRVRALLQRETIDGAPAMASAVMRDRFIRLQAQVQALRAHSLRLVSAAAKGEPLELGEMVCKLVGCELNHQLDLLAMDLCGETGVAALHEADMAADQAWAPLSMYDLGLIIGGGTAQIQKNIISERGLGLPREQKVT